MITWVYDIECYKNFFCITFIPLDVDIRLVNAYKHADLAHNEADKKALLRAMKAKQFTIYNGISSINQSNLIVDFFSAYKVLYGYNSSNSVIRTLEFCINECESLSEQIKQIEDLK